MLKMNELFSKFEMAIADQIIQSKSAVSDTMRKMGESFDIEVELSNGGLLLNIKLVGESSVSASKLLDMILDGSLSRDLEGIIFSERFKDSIIGTSDSDQSSRLAKILYEFRIRLALRLVVGLKQVMDLLFTKQSSGVTLTVASARYMSPMVAVHEVFDNVFYLLVDDMQSRLFHNSLPSVEKGMFIATVISMPKFISSEPRYLLHDLY